jgi:hypothetical protein
MKSKRPKDTTRWLAFGMVLDWMLDKRIFLLEHIESKRPVQAPLDIWWIMAAGVHPLYEMMNITMKSLQSPLLVCRSNAARLRNWSAIFAQGSEYAFLQKTGPTSHWR